MSLDPRDEPHPICFAGNGTALNWVGIDPNPVQCCAVSWQCVHGPLFPFTAHTLQPTSFSFHCTQLNFTVHYSTIDDMVGLLCKFEKGAMHDGQGRPKIFIQNGSNPGLLMEFPFRGWIGTILNADFEEAPTPYPCILILKPELTYDGGTASYHLGMAFLYSSPQIGTMQSPIQLYTDASGTCGYGAY